MVNTSATGGPLAPVELNSPGISTTGVLLENFMHDWVAGVTGLLPKNVRPRWQAEMPNIPEITVDWMAFGLMNRTTEGFPYIKHFASSAGFPNGYDELRRNEILEYMASVYGPNAEYIAEVLREGMYISQNIESLFLNNLAIVSNSNIVTIPELIKEKWVFRADLRFTVRRHIILDYPVLNILHSTETINNAVYTETINI